MNEMFNVAVKFLQALHDSHETGFYGTTLHDAYLPVLTTWQADQELNYVLVFYDRRELRKRAEDTVLDTLTAGDADGQYPCGVIGAVVDSSMHLHEIVPGTEPKMSPDDWAEINARFASLLTATKLGKSLSRLRDDKNETEVKICEMLQEGTLFTDDPDWDAERAKGDLS